MLYKELIELFDILDSASASGSEVVEPGTPLTPGKIYNTNTVYMKARLHQLGAQVMMSQTVGDDLEVMAEALKEAADQAELTPRRTWRET